MQPTTPSSLLPTPLSGEDFCLIFDLDGTLVDSEGLCNQALLDVAPRLNESLESVTRRYRGRRFLWIENDLRARLTAAGHELPEHFEQRYRQRVSDLFDRELKPMPGVLDMLEACRLPYCIASSGPMAKIRHALKISGLDRYFGDRIYSAYDVQVWKPDPGLFLHAANAMGFAADRCIVIEDSDVGVQAAVAAGMKVFQYLPLPEHAPSTGSIVFDDMSKLLALVGLEVDQRQSAQQLTNP